MKVPDRERWQRLSPLLDGLLDLEPVAREARLRALAREDAGLAAELQALLADAAGADRAQFLEGSVDTSGGDGPGPPPCLVGERLGAYEIESLLGQGGTGTVWRARRADGRFDGAVAFKLLHLSLLGHAAALRFEREGAILARLVHSNIARLIDAGVTPTGQPYLVLELVDGERIDRYCDSHQLGVRARVELFRDVLGAVAHAHRHLVVHRDIKPNNILVDRDGHVKLLDFGIAKLLLEGGEDDAVGAGTADAITRAGGHALTPEYAAPEQLRGEAVTTATDVYSLGVLLYQLLTGRHPTAPERGSIADVVQAALVTDPGRLSTAVTVSGQVPSDALLRIANDRDTSPQRLRHQLRGDLENIVAKALRKAPSERYSSVDAFAEDLRRCLAAEPVAARADSLAYRAGRFVTRHRGAVGATVLTLAAILAGLVGTITQARRAQQQTEVAQREAETARRERDGALQQQLLLRGNNDFMVMLMRDAAGGDPGAIRKQLDRAVALLVGTHFEKPIVKVALLRQTAGRYAELGDPGAAARLLRLAIASVDGTDLAAPTSAVPVNLGCSLSRYLTDMDDLVGATAELDRADRLMSAGAELSVPSRVECRVVRSFVDSAAGRFGRASAGARDALAMLEASGVVEGEQLRVVRSALSRALLADGRNADAMAIAGPLLREGLASQGRQSIAVVRRSSIVTSATRQGGQPLIALPLSEVDEASVARLYASHASDAAIDLEQGRVLLALGRDAEAVVMLARSVATARETQSLALLLQAQLGQVEALLNLDRLDDARRLYAETAGAREAAAREGRPTAIESLLLDARFARHAGAAAGRWRALDAARAAVDAAGGSAHPLAFRVARARSEAALAASGTRPLDAALANLEAGRALEAARRGALVADRSSEIGQALLARSRAASALGQAASARADAASAHGHLEASLGRDHPDTLSAASLAGQQAR